MDKLLKVIAFNFIIALALLLFSPALDVKAAENSHTISFNFSSSTWYTFFTHTPQVTSQTTAFDNFAITEDLQGVTYIANSKKEIANYVVDGRSLVVTYPSISCTFKTSPSSIAMTDGFFDGVGLYFVDNLGRKYQLDIENGGTFIINDTAGLTDLSLYALGTVNGTLTTNYSSRYSFCAILKSFNIFVSPGNIIRTITDSEGTVFTVPDSVENPVIVKAYDTQRSVLIDAVDGLCYASYPDNPDLHFYCAAESKLLTVYLEDGTKQYSHLLTTEDAETIGIESVYCTKAWRFTEFLYGSLPQMEVTPLVPIGPVQPPDLGTVVIGAPDENGNMVDEGKVTVPAFNLYYLTKNAVVDFSSLDDATLRTATIEDYCPNILGAFEITTEIDGYISMSFPALHTELDKMKYDWDLDSTVDDQTNLQQEDLELVVILYANGEKYSASPYGGNVRIPVNSGKNRIVFELGLKVKNSYLTKRTVSFRALYEGKIESFDVNIRTYKEQGAADLEKIKDLLENSDKADDLGGAGESLGNIFGDFSQVENEGIGNAVDSIGKLDMDNAFKFGGGLLSALQFWLPVMTNIISGMGDFAVIYTIGIYLSFLAIVVGAVRFAISQSSAKGKNYKGSKGSKGKKGGG